MPIPAVCIFAVPLPVSCPAPAAVCVLPELCTSLPLLPVLSFAGLAPFVCISCGQSGMHARGDEADSRRRHCRRIHLAATELVWHAGQQEHVHGLGHTECGRTEMLQTW